MNLEQQIEQVTTQLDYYEDNPKAPNAKLHTYALATRLESMLKLQFKEQQTQFYNYDY